MTDILEKIRGGLVASCQPVDDGPMDRPDIVAAMAQACVAGGAAGLRIEGIANLKAVRPLVSVPIVGLVKTDRTDTEVRITSSVAEALALVDAGADIVAYDATNRPRPDSWHDILTAIRGAGALAMADCSTMADAERAHKAGAAILGSTLSGYTSETQTSDPLPDFTFLRGLSQLGGFVMAEGRYLTPDLARQAMQSGADCVTVGSALTRLEHMTSWFAQAVADGAK